MVLPLGLSLALVFLGIPAVSVIGDDLQRALGGERGYEALRGGVELDVGAPELGAAECP
jgi:hypothetical protein